MDHDGDRGRVSGFWPKPADHGREYLRTDAWNLPVFRHNMTWYLFAIFTLVTTILWGRLYCGRVCAFGSMTQLLDKIVPARSASSATADRTARQLHQIRAAWRDGPLFPCDARHLDLPICRAVLDVLSARHRAMWIGLAVLLIATIFVRNLYCRFLCPVGAFLGLLSNLTVFRIKRWSECKTCKICEKKCEWGAIRGPKIVAVSACAATTASASTWTTEMPALAHHPEKESAGQARLTIADQCRLHWRET